MTRPMNGLVPIILMASTLLALPGCAVSTRDKAANEWDRAQCNQIIGERERKRCLERVDSD